MRQRSEIENAIEGKIQVWFMMLSAMTSRLIRDVVVVAVVAVLTACYPFAVVPLTNVENTPVINTIYTTVPITPQRAKEMAELKRFGWNDASPIAAIAFNTVVTELLAAQLSGSLRRTALMDGAVISYNIAPISLRATVFDRHASLVATASGTTLEARIAGITSDLKGVNIWRTSDGSSYRSLTSTIASAAIALSPDGRWLVETEGSGTSGYDIYEGKFGGVATIMMDGATSYAGVDAVALDARGEYVAFADRNGLIRVATIRRGVPGSWTEITTPGRARGASVDWRPLAAAFDPTRRWLALIASENLFIYDLQGRATHLFVPVCDADAPAAAVAFDPTGKLIALGTPQGWQIWDVSGKQKVIENTEAPVYALTFSADGRLFAYGDAKGVIHVWGIRSP